MGRAFAHNVEPPPQQRYHRPGPGGNYAPRMVDVATTGRSTCVAWTGYDPASTLDHVQVATFRRAGPPELTRLTTQPGCYGPPAVSAGFAGSVDVVWVHNGCQLLHAARRDGRWQTPRVAGERCGWLRDPTLARDAGGNPWCAYVGSTDDGDFIGLGRLTEAGPVEQERLRLDGFGARPGLCIDGSGHIVLVHEHHVDGASRIAVQAGVPGALCPESIQPEWVGHHILPRPTMATGGALWLTWLAEQLVERDGVLGRAATVRAARRVAGRWQIVPGPAGVGAANLYEGLLPRRRYFGYAGLRRNPRPVATDDGRIHVVWEAQRGEDADWQGVWNGRLLACAFDGAAWRGPVLWHDGGCCHAIDHRAVHPAGGVTILVKGDHREAGDDFQPHCIDTHGRPAIGAADPAPWSGWRPWPRPARPARHHMELDGRRLHLYFGDFHNHCVFSPDAEGLPDELFHCARDVACLDFVGITDNDFYPEKALLAGEIAHLRHLVRHLQQPGRFLPFCGYEWTFHRDDGQQSYNHRSIIFLDREKRIARRIDPDGHDESAFRRSLTAMAAFAHAHHGQFHLLGTAQEANVEVTSAWAVNIERSSSVHDHLDAGHRFGFIGGTDSHRMLPGLSGALAAVWAEDLTRDALVAALRARRCYATMGGRTMIDFRLNGAPMGQVVSRPRARVFDVRVVAERPLRRLGLVRNGAIIQSFTPAGRSPSATLTWTDGAPPAGPAWYYVRVEDETPWRDLPHNVCQAAGPLAWSSPIWVT